MVITVLGVSDVHTQLLMTRLYYFGCTILSAYFINVVLVPAGAIIKKDLEKSLDGKDRTKSANKSMFALYDRIKIFYRETRNAGFTNTASTIVFAIIPWLYDKISYQFAVAWGMGGAIGFVATLFLSDTNRQSKKRSKSVAPSTQVSTSSSSSGGSSASEV